MWGGGVELMFLVLLSVLGLLAAAGLAEGGRRRGREAARYHHLLG